MLYSPRRRFLQETEGKAILAQSPNDVLIHTDFEGELVARHAGVMRNGRHNAQIYETSDGAESCRLQILSMESSGSCSGL